MLLFVIFCFLDMLLLPYPCAHFCLNLNWWNEAAKSRPDETVFVCASHITKNCKYIWKTLKCVVAIVVNTYREANCDVSNLDLNSYSRFSESGTNLHLDLPITLQYWVMEWRIIGMINAKPNVRILVAIAERRSVLSYERV